ncbi:MAG: hypothetical protein CMA63_02190 [Euryarchaeota archaeon]|nr:hypothetical protein [Euryarchaeota archaeon]|tara:strand:+ start:29635 stop:30453 length:819 start_codon:yes stop_codon:yes gene_type:complete
MREVVVIKWGGGLITDKTLLCTTQHSVINELAKTVRDCVDNGLRVILVHGAGSYGHLRAKYWKLHLGSLPKELFKAQVECATQEQAVQQVRDEMMTLNSHVVKSLHDAGLETVVHPPHQWVTNTGTNFLGSVERFTSDDETTVHVTYGDVVPVDSNKEFGILSGDDLVVRLSLEVEHVQRLIFAIGGVDGLLRVPPAQAVDEDLIEIWSSDITFEGHHDSLIDVTGGIGLKAARGAVVAANGIDVFMVNGGIPERVLSAMMGQKVRGTKIIY